MNDWLTTMTFLTVSATFGVLISWLSKLSSHVCRLDGIVKLHQQALTDTRKLLGEILDALDHPENLDAKGK